MVWSAVAAMSSASGPGILPSAGIQRAAFLFQRIKATSETEDMMTVGASMVPA